MNNNLDNSASRLWHKDVTLWSRHPGDRQGILDRLGWLHSIDWMQQQLEDLLGWVREVVDAKRFDRVVVLGMGGSSLAPEVISRLFSPREGYPKLEILDSTCPEMVKTILASGIDKSLFVVASKSGTTLETISLYKFFYDQIQKFSRTPGDHFVAITDPESWLASHAAESGFARLFLNPSDIGGRYSALSFFGLMPAALYGVDIASLLARAQVFSDETKTDQIEENSALALGQYIGQHAIHGRDKMILEFSPKLQPLGTWVEQLVAESTGKQGVGILPVCGGVNVSGRDQFFVEMLIEENSSKSLSSNRMSWSLNDPLDIGAEFFKWEFATAIAAGYLGVNPFDQPDVEEAKASTGRFISGQVRLETVTVAETDDYVVELVGKTGESFHGAIDVSPLIFQSAPVAGNYVGLLGYLPITPDVERLMEGIRQQMMECYNVVCTIGFGPRYLHSTGQLHKGGASKGHFVQFVSAAETDLAVPEQDYTFARLLRAQADGDITVLAKKNLPVMRIRLKGDRLPALGRYANDLESAIAAHHD